MFFVISCFTNIALDLLFVVGLRMGVRGAAVATVYTAIPRVTPDGIYGSGTEASVRAFQSVFGLPQTGVVDFATWSKISHIYVGISRIAELN